VFLDHKLPLPVVMVGILDLVVKILQHLVDQAAEEHLIQEAQLTILLEQVEHLAKETQVVAQLVSAVAAAAAMEALGNQEMVGLAATAEHLAFQEVPNLMQEAEAEVLLLTLPHRDQVAAAKLLLKAALGITPHIMAVAVAVAGIMAMPEQVPDIKE
jgi:hypothetical protein